MIAESGAAATDFCNIRAWLTLLARRRGKALQGYWETIAVAAAAKCGLQQTPEFGLLPSPCRSLPEDELKYGGGMSRRCLRTRDNSFPTSAAGLEWNHSRLAPLILAGRIAGRVASRLPGFGRSRASPCAGSDACQGARQHQPHLAPAVDLGQCRARRSAR